MINCIGIGLTINDIEEMEIGEMYDLIITKSNMYVSENKEEKQEGKTWRWATQSDFDRL